MNNVTDIETCIHIMTAPYVQKERLYERTKCLLHDPPDR